LPREIVLSQADPKSLQDDTTAVDLTATHHSKIEEPTDQDALAETARQALSDLAGSPRRKLGRAAMGTDSMEWLR